MSDQTELGKLGEKLAAEYLAEKKNYVILERNYKWDRAEVDIIARHKDRIVFVEVKTRLSPYLSDPALMVPMRKQRQILKVADYYMKEYPGDEMAQFDIVFIVANSKYVKIDHYDEAFVPGLS